eukprot:scaffold417341_cov19-Prasinocladus_malaysianus.AAC.1
MVAKMEAMGYGSPAENEQPGECKRPHDITAGRKLQRDTSTGGSDLSNSRTIDGSESSAAVIRPEKPQRWEATLHLPTVVSRTE